MMIILRSRQFRLTYSAEIVRVIQLRTGPGNLHPEEKEKWHRIRGRIGLKVGLAEGSAEPFLCKDLDCLSRYPICTDIRSCTS